MKKGQVFTFDYIAGFLMFVVIAIIAGKQLINILPAAGYNDLYDENVYFSLTLLQPGYPEDWDNSNVLIPGIAENNRLDQAKLADLTTFSYDQTKSFFHIKYEYIFFFQENNSILPINGQCLYGYAIPFNATSCEPDFDAIVYDDLVKTSRLVIYNSKIVEMVLYSWR